MPFLGFNLLTFNAKIIAMPSITEQINFISLLLDALPSKAPGFDKARLSSWLSQQANPISYRQLLRYLEDLEAIGWIRREKQGKSDFWFRVYRGTRLVDMTPERAFALQLIRHKLHHLMPPQLVHALHEEFRLAHDKLSLHYPHEQQWLGKIGEIPALLEPPEFHEGVFGVLAEALLENKWLDISYRNKDGKEGLRQVMPLGIASKDGVYYLIGRYADEELSRQFRIDRISNAIMREESFSYPENFRLVDYMDDGFFNYPNGGAIRLVARMHRTPARHLQDTPLSPDQTIESVDENWIRLTATVQDSQRLYWWILGFGDQIVIEAPSGLLKHIQDTVARMVGHYAGQ